MPGTGQFPGQVDSNAAARSHHPGAAARGSGFNHRFPGLSFADKFEVKKGRSLQQPQTLHWGSPGAGSRLDPASWECPGAGKMSFVQRGVGRRMRVRLSPAVLGAALLCTRVVVEGAFFAQMLQICKMFFILLAEVLWGRECRVRTHREEPQRAHGRAPAAPPRERRARAGP